jgi:hypothetical protein
MLLTMLIVNLAVLGMVTYLVFQAAQLRSLERSELVAALKSCISQPR